MYEPTDGPFNLDDMTVADLFGIERADGHDACHDAAEARTDAVTRALEDNVEPCVADRDPAAERWIAIAEYTDMDGTVAVRLHTSPGLTAVDVAGLLEVGKEAS